MQLLAAGAARLLRQPAHERGAVPAPAAVRAGDEVVDVEVAAPREVLLDAEAGDGRRVVLAGLEGADEAIAGGALAVGERGERLGRRALRAQLQQGAGGAQRLALGDLSDVGHDVRIVCVASRTLRACSVSVLSRFDT